MNRGMFISLEGIDGSGKSTVKKLLINYFRSQGLKVFDFSPSDIVRQNSFETDLKLSYKERTCLYNSIKRVKSALEELDRKQDNINYDGLMIGYLDLVTDYSKIIEHHLENGTMVIADRWFHSSVAYNAIISNTICNKLIKSKVFGDNTNEDMKYLNSLIEPIIKPTVTIYLDVTPEVGMERVEERAKIINSTIDKKFESVEKLTSVRNAYLELANIKDHDHYKMIHKVENKFTPFDTLNEIVEIIRKYNNILLK